MNRLIGTYGKVLLICMIVGIIIGSFGVFGTKLYDISQYQEGESADNLKDDIRILAEQKKYPFFVGSQCITLSMGYKGKDGQEGFSREDALELVEAYEYVLNEDKVILKNMDKTKIKVYPFDNPKESQREVVDVSNTGKYTIKYAVEGESGLKTEMTMLILVDILPDGIEYKESAGGQNKGSN